MIVEAYKVEHRLDWHFQIVPNDTILSLTLVCLFVIDKCVYIYVVVFFCFESKFYIFVFSIISIIDSRYRRKKPMKKKREKTTK